MLNVGATLARVGYVVDQLYQTLAFLLSETIKYLYID